MIAQWAGPATRARRAIGALTLVTAIVSVAGCTASVDGSGEVDASAARAYSVERSASAAREQQSATSDAEYRLCATVTTSVVSMLRSYNAFVGALNTEQAFADLGGADRRAVEQLTGGATAISGALTPQVSAAVRSVVQALLDRTGALSRAVNGQQRAALNAASTAWIRARDVVLGSCRPYTAAGASSAPASPAPSPGG